MAIEEGNFRVTLLKINGDRQERNFHDVETAKVYASGTVSDGVFDRGHVEEWDGENWIPRATYPNHAVMTKFISSPDLDHSDRA